MAVGRATGSYELGPRSIALMRRLVAGIELLTGAMIPDPGADAENTELDEVDLTSSTPTSTATTHTPSVDLG